MDLCISSLERAGLRIEGLGEKLREEVIESVPPDARILGADAYVIFLNVAVAMRGLTSMPGGEARRRWRKFVLNCVHIVARTSDRDTVVAGDSELQLLLVRAQNPGVEELPPALEQSRLRSMYNVLVIATMFLPHLEADLRKKDMSMQHLLVRGRVPARGGDTRVAPRKLAVYNSYDHDNWQIAAAHSRGLSGRPTGAPAATHLYASASTTSSSTTRTAVVSPAQVAGVSRLGKPCCGRPRNMNLSTMSTQAGSVESISGVEVSAQEVSGWPSCDPMAVSIGGASEISFRLDKDSFDLV